MNLLSAATTWRTVLVWVGTVALLLSLSTSASALHIFDLTISAEDTQGQTLGSTDLDELDSLGLIGESSTSVSESAWLTDPATMGSGWTVDSWSSTVDFDPFITNNFSVTNNTGGTAIFSISVGATIPAFNANEIVQSTIQLSVLDDDGVNQASVSTTGGKAIYQAFVNGGAVPVLTFFDDPYTLSCTDPFDCAVAGNGEDTDGVLSQPFGPTVVTQLGLTIQFELSDGDSAQVLSRFEVVPEPGTAMLLGLGLVGLAARRRAAR